MIQKPGSDAIVQNSLGLNALCQKLEDRSGLDILDLGPAQRANVEFWSRFGNSMFIADLRTSLPLPLLEEDQQFPESEWVSILELPEGRSFDVILAWDLLNYIELSALPSLIGYLSRFCRPGTILFFLIFDRLQMPENISTYQIVDEGHIGCENKGAGMRACPRHQPRALAMLLSKFRSSDSFRLKNGIMEYLFTYEGP